MSLMTRPHEGDRHPEVQADQAEGIPPGQGHPDINVKPDSAGPVEQPELQECGELVFTPLDLPSEQELQHLVMSITNTTLLDVHIELPVVARQGKETLSLISDYLRSGTWSPVDARELELFMHGVVLGSAKIVGTEQFTRAVNAILSDPSTWERLRQIADRASRQIADRASPLAAVADQAANKILLADDPNRETLGWLVLGGAILLAIGAGVIVPLLTASAIAEVILTNEVAIAAVVIGAAALIRRS